MDGSTTIGEAPQPGLAAEWRLGGFGDFNADGQTDIAWRNVVTGENPVWLMAATVRSSQEALPLESDLNWQIVGAADFNADGKPDLAWRHGVTGVNRIWLMNGTAKVGDATLPAEADPTWQIVAVAEIDGDARADLIWRNAATGDTRIWFMDGTLLRSSDAFLAASGSHLGPDWQIAAAADVNQDGYRDLVFRNRGTGENVICYLTGTAKSAEAAVTGYGAPDGLGWGIGSPRPVVVTVRSNALAAAPGSTITWTAEGHGGIAPLAYCFFLNNLDAPGWSEVRAYGSDPRWTFASVPAGHYWVEVWVRGAGMTRAYEAYADAATVTVAPQPLSLTAVTATPAGATAGTPITWTANAAYGTAPLQYRFWRQDATGGWTIPQDWGPSNSYTWTTPTEGPYLVQVWVKNAGSANAYDAWANANTVVVSRPVVTSVTVAPDATTTTVGATVTWTATATGGVAPVQYRFWRKPWNTSGWAVVQEYSEANTYVWPNILGGIYDVRVEARSAGASVTEATADAAMVTVAGLPPPPPATWLTPPTSAELPEYYHVDALGSVRAVTKMVSGQLQVVRHDYMPFGEEVPQDPPNTPNQADKRLFTGKERDYETGLDYFGARYYRSDLGRFTTVDPGHASATPDDPQSWNAYAYVRNNPLKYVDPDERRWFIRNGDARWVEPNKDGSYTSPGEGWTPLAPGEEAIANVGGILSLIGEDPKTGRMGLQWLEAEPGLEDQTYNIASTLFAYRGVVSGAAGSVLKAARDRATTEAISVIKRNILRRLKGLPADNVGRSGTHGWTDRELAKELQIEARRRQAAQPGLAEELRKEAERLFQRAKGTFHPGGR